MSLKPYALALLFLGSILLPPQRVLAHDPPQGVALVWDVGASEEQEPRVVVTNRGLVFRGEVDGARTLRLRCNEALNVPISLPPSVLARGDGSLLTSTYEGVYTTADSACSLAAASGWPEASLGPATVSGNAWLLTTRTVGVPSQVLVSTDEGASWSLRYAGPLGDYHQDLLVAPSRPERVYLSGLALGDGGRSSLCGVSDDGGASFARKTRSDELSLFAVHPTQPDVVFAYQASDPRATAFRVLRSADACETFVPVLEGLHIAPSSLAAADSGALFLGVAGAGGLYRSDDQGLTFARVSPHVQSVTCLVQRGPRLWLCANLAPNTYGIWWSDDEGNSFQEFLSFDEVEGPVACASGAERSVCAAPWYDYYTELHLFGGPSDDAGMTSDAGGLEDGGAGGAGGESPRRRKGGRCQLSVERTSEHWGGWLLWALGLTLGLRRVAWLLVTPRR